VQTEVDTQPKGLLVPAWTAGRNYHGAKVVFVAESPFAGKTVPEVAKELKVRSESVMHYAIQGICPSTLTPRGKRGDAYRQVWKP
jgi:hypothetical protein